VTSLPYVFLETNLDKEGEITMVKRFSCFELQLPVALLIFALLFVGSIDAEAAPGDWPLYSYNFSNSNFNAEERILRPSNARFLRRAWETFNDDTLVDGSPPTGFVLESALGLQFPSAVVGVIASPIIRDGTIYYVDALGTVFARDARSGEISNPLTHWTTTLVDPDYDNASVPILPELIYTSPIVTDSHVWILGSAYGQLHLLDRKSGQELDFDPDTPEIDPFQLVSDLPFSSILGEAVIIESDEQTLLVASINVILNDALVQGEEGGLQIAFDVSEPTHPIEVWRRNTLEVDPATGLRFGSGVSAGSGLAVDLKRHLLLGGTGQNTSDPYPGYPDPNLAPPGFIDRSDSLYAIDYFSDKFVWTNQFFNGDVFNLNDPVSTGPNREDGPRDADVLSPPVLFTVYENGRWRDLAANGSKGGLFKAVDRDTGETVWERQISKPTGIGGIQAGAAVANGVVYVAGFEGIDDGFSDAQFGVSLETGLFPNAFFATFSPAFWADVEDTSDDANPATGMRVKVYALDAASGKSRWNLDSGKDYVDLRAGAALRHVSVANGLLFVTTSSGRLFTLNAATGEVLFSDQTVDLNAEFNLSLGKPHHASMNGGSIISKGMVYVPYGAQNNPSGGLIAYELNFKPYAWRDVVWVSNNESTIINALANDFDPNGDSLQFSQVAGVEINIDDGLPDVVTTMYGTIEVFNPGDDMSQPFAAYLKYTPNDKFKRLQKFAYQVEDMAPKRKVNGVELEEPEPTHTPRHARAIVWLLDKR
jgi:outer membrane protein assembly factor BamB